MASMSLDDKIETVLVILDGDENATDAVVTVYLGLAEQKILDRMYPMVNMERGSVPAMYDYLHCELAARLYLRKGGEGESSHEENGINRTYGSVDDEDILSRVTPYAAVM